MSERRYVTHEFETRAVSDSVATIEGYAAVFEKNSQPLGWDGFLERIAKGAFAKTIKEADVRALVNHDPSLVLGRNKAGTLRLAEDSTGLHYEVDVDLLNSDSSNAYRMIDRGDISQSSFGFEVIRDEWDYSEDDEPVIRTLKEVRLFDVSPVTYPAYLDATVDVKRALRSLAKDSDKSYEVLEAAVKSNSLRTVLTDDTQEENGPATSHPLEIMRRRLVLAQKKSLLTEGQIHAT